MRFRMIHTNLNVQDLDLSLAFYEEALDMREVRRKTAEDGSFILVYLSDGKSSYELELTWLAHKKEPYNLGDNETHIAFETDEYAAAHTKHEAMECICFENPKMGIYFINDPDDYWLEIVPAK